MTDLKTLDETLNVYGSDRTRWPQGRAEELASVLASSEGVRLLREAQSLDRVLDASDEASSASQPDMDALLERIMTGTHETEATPGAAPRRQGVSVGTARVAFMGGVMAAALLIGVFAGVNGFGAVVTSSGVELAAGPVTEAPDDALLADLTLSADFELGDDV